MARRKDFGTPQAKDNEPVEFAVFGEVFHCVEEVQGAVLLDLAEVGSEEDSGKQASAIASVFKNILKDESYERFHALTHSKDRIVPLELLTDIMAWLLEQYSGDEDAPSGAGPDQS